MFRQGDEMGRFLLGSTVVLLWPRDTLRFNRVWSPGGAVRMGEVDGAGSRREFFDPDDLAQAGVPEIRYGGVTACRMADGRRSDVQTPWIPAFAGMTDLLP
jgi:hypothetical protein